MREWLVTDQRGGFAMGTIQGPRLRKYHAFYSGIASRSEQCFLADFEMEIAGRKLWPHSYWGESGSLILHPSPAEVPVEYTETPDPVWRWDVPEAKGTLQFAILPVPGVGIRYSWKWNSKSAHPVLFKLRPLFAMRNLHAVGGKEWKWEPDSSHSSLVHVSGGTTGIFVRLWDEWRWVDQPDWYYSFYYPEEQARGYDYSENLFSAGELRIDLSARQEAGWMIGPSREELLDLSPSGIRGGARKTSGRKKARKIFDFVLRKPSGVVAGFPWFGEWGRDTFVSLPGIVMSGASDGARDFVWSWAEELLSRWGRWISEAGMLPNLLQANHFQASHLQGGKDPSPQWDSADSTLWWIHSLASLWVFSLNDSKRASHWVENYNPLLQEAIQSIEKGRHRHLRLNSDGLLEVTTPHSTWMDAQIEGRAVTPRLGALPEINALWFQARCLQSFWNERSFEGRMLGQAVLGCQEPDRPNRVFMHSLPLAPSFVLNDRLSLQSDVELLVKDLWTPVGLRTLSPHHPDFRPDCNGTQQQRDEAYHQGVVWSWLGSHFEMARFRLNAETQVSSFPEGMPISHHLPEIFDALEPFRPRGCPAQAWSLACWEEARIRREKNLDKRLQRFL